MLKAIEEWKIRRPGTLGPRARSAAFAILRATSGLRCGPDFLVIGAQKSGSTSLFNYLAMHPQIMPSLIKEPRYFSENFDRGEAWYRAHFPMHASRWMRTRNGARPLVYEGSTTYISHAQAARRISQALPNVKAILVLRDPAERAISHFYHAKRKGRESDSLESAMAQEFERIDAEREEWKRCAERDLPWNTLDARRYLLHGLYRDQIDNWLWYFPRDSLLLLGSRSLWDSPATCFEQVTKFLGIPSWAPPEMPAFNTGGYAATESSVIGALEEFFAPHNERLLEFVCGEAPWNF